jgi:hypothetical protein
MHPLQMDPLDHTLETIVREWVASNAADRATVRVKTAKRGGPPSIEVMPRNAAAITTTLWVADDGAHVAFWIGGGSSWADHVALDRESVGELLSAVIAARAGEEVRRVRGRVVARKGYVELAPERRLTYGELSVLALLPGIKWERVVYQPY